jgi:hypothetical protein
MTASTKVLWRVEIRLTKTAKWKKLGLWETRSNARLSALMHRNCYRYEQGKRLPPVGFGNTRVVRYVKGG